MKAAFGTNPKYNSFFCKLQLEQDKTDSKIRDIANCVPLPKHQTQSNLFTRAIQDAAKAKYKLFDIKDQIEGILTALLDPASS